MSSAPTVTNHRQSAAPPPSPLRLMAERCHIDPGKLMEVLRNTVIKSTAKHTPTNEEVAAFVLVANRYSLDPFTRQIHAFYSEKAGIVPIVGIDGWAALVNQRMDFDGCDFEEHSDPDGNITSTTCVMYVKNRSRPIRVTEWLNECKRPTAPWQQMPRRMLRHKAYMQAARLCFGLSGIYDEDEGRDIVRDSTPRVKQQWQSMEPLKPEVREIPAPEPKPPTEEDLEYEEKYEHRLAEVAGPQKPDIPQAPPEIVSEPTSQPIPDSQDGLWIHDLISDLESQLEASEVNLTTLRISNEIDRKKEVLPAEDYERLRGLAKAKLIAQDEAANAGKKKK